MLLTLVVPATHFVRGRENPHRGQTGREGQCGQDDLPRPTSAKMSVFVEQVSQHGFSSSSISSSLNYKSYRAMKIILNLSALHAYRISLPLVSVYIIQNHRHLSHGLSTHWVSTYNLSAEVLFLFTNLYALVIKKLF